MQLLEMHNRWKERATEEHGVGCIMDGAIWGTKAEKQNKDRKERENIKVKV